MSMNDDPDLQLRIICSFRDDGASGGILSLLKRLKRPCLKCPCLKRSPESISTPLGHVPYRHVNTHVKLEDGVERAKNRCYVRGDE